jgi:hypothetical protein
MPRGWTRGRALRPGSWALAPDGQPAAAPAGAPGSATLLRDGTVLLATLGGALAERYDPALG